MAVSTMMDGILRGINDEDVDHDNDEPDKSVVNTGAEEDAEFDLKSQDNIDIIDLYLVMYYGLIIEIQIQ